MTTHSRLYTVSVSWVTRTHANETECLASCYRVLPWHWFNWARLLEVSLHNRNRSALRVKLLFSYQRKATLNRLHPLPVYIESVLFNTAITRCTRSKPLSESSERDKIQGRTDKGWETDQDRQADRGRDTLSQKTQMRHRRRISDSIKTDFANGVTESSRIMGTRRPRIS